jgi:hypothetical protein
MHFVLSYSLGINVYILAAFCNYFYGGARGLVVITLGLNSGDPGSNLGVVHEINVSRTLARCAVTGYCTGLPRPAQSVNT